jgi:hypothetical protein
MDGPGIGSHGGLCRTPIIAIYIVDFQNIEGELATLRVR